MPKTKAKKRTHPQRRDAIPPLQGVKFEDALKAAMETPLPDGWKPKPHVHKAAKSSGGRCVICGRGANDEE